MDYLRLGIGAKQAHAREQMRESSIQCPLCDVHTTPRDMMQHLAKRCAGRGEPHRGSAWVTWREARRVVAKQTLSEWVRCGKVRWMAGAGGAHDRRYLLRDLVLCMAFRSFLRSARRKS